MPIAWYHQSEGKTPTWWTGTSYMGQSDRYLFFRLAGRFIAVPAQVSMFMHTGGSRSHSFCSIRSYSGFAMRLVTSSILGLTSCSMMAFGINLQLDTKNFRVDQKERMPSMRPGKRAWRRPTSKSRASALDSYALPILLSLMQMCAWLISMGKSASVRKGIVLVSDVLEY